MSHLPNSTAHLYDKVELAGDAVDPITGALTTESKHSKLTDSGDMFHMSSKVLGILDNGVNYVLISIPATVNMHLVKVRANTGAGDIDLAALEAPTVSAAGVVIPTFATNRANPGTPAVVLTGAPTVTTPGTIIHDLWLPPSAAGVGQSVSGVLNAEAGEEWIMKADTLYLWRLTNNSGVTIDAWFEFLWYEVPVA